MNQKISQLTKKKGNKIPFGTYFILGLSLGSLAFLGVCNPGGMRQSLGGIVAYVDKQKITAYQFRRAYEAQSEQLRKQYTDSYDPSVLKVSKQVVDQLVRDRIIYLEAKKLGLSPDQDYLAQVIVEENPSLKDPEVFRKNLRRSDYTETSFLEEIGRDISRRRLFDYLNKSVFISSPSTKLSARIKNTKLVVRYIKIDSTKMKTKISSQEVDKFLAQEGSKEKTKSWYDRHIDEYKVEERVHARHILVAYKGSRRADAKITRTKVQARNLANDILKKVNKSGADFVKLAKAYTDEGQGKTSGGDLGFFTKKNMVKEFSEVAFALPRGKISGVVESAFGFHIIKTIDRKEAKDFSLKQVEREIVEKQIQQSKGLLLAKKEADSLLKTLKSKAKIDEILKTKGFMWEKTKEFSLADNYIPGLSFLDELRRAIYDLKESGQTYTNAIKSGRDYYILQLLERREDKLDEEKIAQQQQQSISQDAKVFSTKFIKALEDSYRKNGKIEINQDYLALDNPSTEN
jgi:peptidyl-prolyl cis-trans isomerase D